MYFTQLSALQDGVREIGVRCGFGCKMTCDIERLWFSHSVWITFGLIITVERLATRHQDIAHHMPHDITAHPWMLLNTYVTINQYIAVIIESLYILLIVGTHKKQQFKLNERGIWETACEAEGTSLKQDKHVEKSLWLLKQ